MRASVAIVAAAGSGERLGAGIPKAFVSLRGKTILEVSLLSLAKQGIARIIVALPPENMSLNSAPSIPNIEILTVSGGMRRQDSVLNAAKLVPHTADVVFIHDAARPLLRAGIVEELHSTAIKYGAAVPALPCADTLKYVEDGQIHRTVDRSRLYGVQTPQAFRRDIFDAMLKHYSSIEMTDDCSVAEIALGLKPHIVTGSARTLKITTPEDLRIVELMYREEGF